MGLNQVNSGKNVPNEVNVIIEIPMNSGPVKYEVDKSSGVLRVDRFMTSAMYYPTNYGYVPHTLSLDGDPVDVLVVAPVPLLSGSVIACRPIGMLEMTDESGQDAKILAVPTLKLTKLYQDIETVDDLPIQLKQSIEHFFHHYKDLEEGKWVKINGWKGIDAAFAEINDSIKRYQI